MVFSGIGRSIKLTCGIGLGLLTFIVSGYAQSVEKAHGLIENINTGNFSFLQEYYFSPVLRSKVDSASLVKMWKSLELLHGPFMRVSTLRVDKEKRLVILSCSFTLSVLTWRVSFDSDSLINGFHILAVDKVELYLPPPYADQGVITEKEVHFEGRFGRLRSMLTVPKHKKSMPLVIFLHGSGPQDLDESIGPNKPFKDLALGLATNGIASLRFDKTTFVYRKDISTVKDEVIEDCLNAISFCKKIDSLKFEKIFILGHSLGAYVAPRIAKDHVKVDGLVLLSTIFKSFPAIFKEQLDYLAALPDSLRPGSAEIGFLRNEISKTDDIDALGDSAKILNIPKSYWKDLENYDVVKTVRELRIPMLFLQGGRDYQVGVENFNMWQKKLIRQRNIDFAYYPDLNHLFFKGKGASFPGEYLKQGHVFEDVIRDICRWIQGI
jgi:uncharacterized protein